MSDRTVYAEAQGEEIVRYDRAGKWYIELLSPSPDAGMRRHVGVFAAALRALELEQQAGTIYPGRPGGQTFDTKVRTIRAQRAAGFR